MTDPPLDSTMTTSPAKRACTEMSDLVSECNELHSSLQTTKAKMKQCAQSIHDHTLVSLAKLNFETAICEQHALFTQKNDPTLGPGILAYLTEHYSPINSCVHVDVWIMFFHGI